MAIKGLILLSLTIALAQMTLSWFLAKRWNFYSLVDVSWSYGIALISLALGLWARAMAIDDFYLPALLSFGESGLEHICSRALRKNSLKRIEDISKSN